LWITSAQHTIAINLHKDFMTSMSSGFFHEQMDIGLTYWPNHSGETQMSKQEEEEACRLY
jgi:hypothetical protein